LKLYQFKDKETKMRKAAEILKDAQKAIERLGGLKCDEHGNSDYEWLDNEIESFIRRHDAKNK
jgi:hypothetical protein